MRLLNVLLLLITLATTTAGAVNIINAIRKPSSASQATAIISPTPTPSGTPTQTAGYIQLPVSEDAPAPVSEIPIADDQTAISDVIPRPTGEALTEEATYIPPTLTLSEPSPTPSPKPTKAAKEKKDKKETKKDDD